MKQARLAMLAGSIMAVGLMGGCRTTGMAATQAGFGSADASLLLAPAGAPRIELRQNQGFAFPDRIGSVEMPEYPPELLPLRLEPVELCLDLDIDESGAVTAITHRIDASCPAPTSGYPARFTAVAMDAARRWRFRPAYLCTIPDGETAADVCSEPDAVKVPTQIRLPYLFRFVQHDGNPDISARRDAH